MTYVIAKHKKTGSERIFTEPVFRANEHQYKFVAYTDNPNAKKKEAVPAPVPAKAVTLGDLNRAVVNQEAKALATKVDADVMDSVLTDLQAQYKALTGKTANKKWGVPKLTEAIKAAETPA